MCRFKWKKSQLGTIDNKKDIEIKREKQADPDNLDYTWSHLKPRLCSTIQWYLYNTIHYVMQFFT